jgi:hypothetical protein
MHARIMQWTIACLYVFVCICKIVYVYLIVTLETTCYSTHVYMYAFRSLWLYLTNFQLFRQTKNKLDPYNLFENIFILI